MTPKHVAATMAALNLAATPPHLRTPQGTTSAAGAAPQGAAPRAAASAFSWDAVVAEMNAANGLSQSGPCPDPELVAMISGEAAR